MRARIVTTGLILVLAAQAVALAPAAAEPTRWIVGFHGEPDLSIAPGRLVRIDAPLRFAVVESSDPAFAATVGVDSRVRYVERDFTMRALHTPNDPRWSASNHYGPRLIQAHVAWDIARGSTSTILCVIDSGLRATHEDFAGPRLLGGWDFANDDSDPRDDQGHGTAVTSVAAATMDNGKGIAGVAQVSILVAKFITPAGTGQGSDANSAMRWCADNGAHVISMSFGAPQDAQSTRDATAYARARGAVLVAGSGNDGCDNCVLFPAAIPDVLAVGCVDSSKSRCSFSSRGPEVDLAAPGFFTISASNGGDSDYAETSGTSLSTPFVSAAAALAKSSNPALSGEDIRTMLLNSAEDLGPSGLDTAFGYGLVRADRVVTNSAPVMRSLACDRSPAAVASSVTCSFRAEDASPGLRYLIDWGDGSVELFPASGHVPANVAYSASHAWSDAGTFSVGVSAIDNHPGGSLASDARFIQQIVQANAAPASPIIACAPSPSLPAETVACTFVAADDSFGLSYTVDWGDGSPAQRVPASGVAPVGTAAAATHAWSARGAYTIVATATDDDATPLTGASRSRAHAVVGCRFHREQDLVAPPGLFHVEDFTADRFTFPTTCPGTSFTLRGASVLDDFDVCWTKLGNNLRCDQNDGPESGVVPTGANGAVVQYRVGAAGRYILDVPAASGLPTGNVMKADDGTIDRSVALGFATDAAEKDLVAPSFLFGLEQSTATIRILGQAPDECFPDTPTVAVRLNSAPVASFDPCVAFPRGTFGYAEFRVPAALVAEGRVNTLALVKAAHPPGFGDVILALDTSASAASRLTVEDVPIQAELMWEIVLTPDLPLP